jgi:hypothetical protein
MEKSKISLEHFDLAPPSKNGDVTIIYPHVYRAAKEAARIAGWSFRSYSSADSVGTLEDFQKKQIRAFPTLILYKEGLEMGRYTSLGVSAEMIISWAEKLIS